MHPSERLQTSTVRTGPLSNTRNSTARVRYTSRECARSHLLVYAKCNQPSLWHTLRHLLRHLLGLPLLGLLLLLLSHPVLTGHGLGLDHRGLCRRRLYLGLPFLRLRQSLVLLGNLVWARHPTLGHHLNVRNSRDRDFEVEWVQKRSIPSNLHKFLDALHRPHEAGCILSTHSTG